MYVASNFRTFVLAISLGHGLVTARPVTPIEQTIKRLSARDSCDSACSAAVTAAKTCSDSTDSNCICEVPGFGNAAEACLRCDGGTVLSQSGLEALQQLSTACGQSSSADESDSAVVITAWGPEGIDLSSETLTVLSTGASETLGVAVYTVTGTNSAGNTGTATVTDFWDLSPTAVAELVVAGPDEDYEYAKCFPGAGGLATCLIVDGTGTVPTATSTITVSGSTVEYTMVASA